jgi:hypothetical protein
MSRLMSYRGMKKGLLYDQLVNGLRHQGDDLLI